MFTKYRTIGLGTKLVKAVSTCSYGPTIAAITAAKALGARKAQLLCYKTSGDVTGNFSAVVGYASIAFTK